jgi:alpha-glucosidase
MRRPWFGTLLIALGAGTAAAAEFDVRSPDGRLVVTMATARVDGVEGVPVYRVAWDGRPVIASSRLGLELADGMDLSSGFEARDVLTETHDRTWENPWGERRTVRDAYRQRILELRPTQVPRLVVRLTVRAYDEGVALKYSVLPGTGEALRNATVTRERTEFRFPADATAWATYSAQGRYEAVPLARLRRGCERPLVVRLADDLYVAVGEAKLVDFARMKLDPVPADGDRGAGVAAALDGAVEATLPCDTPWRVIMVAASPGMLLEHNDLILNLNDPCALDDTSWIRPGKVIREISLTTEGGLACVDFAAKHGLQFVEFDAGWYGPEFDNAADATGVHVDPKRSKGPLDLHAVIRHARERGIGVILYVNRRALERQLDEILPLYRSWGVAGVKYGFVQVGPQRWTSWLHAAVRRAAEHRLMVDIHDEYRPTGYSRTYPNLMTQEGIGGDETSPANDQTLTLLFTRLLAGPADNTVCYFDERVDRNATHAYQLAKAVCLFSPWQFLYWYDRPAPADAPAPLPAHVIGDEPELQFSARMPTVWDDTRVLHGRIGEYAAIARRSGEAWYVGVMNAGTARTLDLKLDFLEPGKAYEATTYRDDPSVPTRTHVRIERRPVDSATTLRADLGPKGGEAIRIAPADAPGVR